MTPAKNQMRRIIGVDLHPDSFAAAQVTGSTIAEMRIEKRFTRIPCSDWETFLQKQIPANSIIVCEAGCNSFEFMRIAERFGHQTCVLNSKSAGQLAKAYCKNDPHDALRCAKIYLCGLAAHIWQPDEETVLRREIYSAYQQAVTDQTRASNRIKSFLTEHKVRLKNNQKLRKELTRQFVFDAYRWSESQRFVLRSLFLDFDRAAEKRREYLEFIGKTVLQYPIMTQLMQLCGIRLLTAYCIVAVIGDINRFESPKQLVAYLGLAPCIKASGNAIASCGMMDGGKTQAKSSLVQAAHAVLKSKSASGAALKEWGIKLKMRKSIHVAVGGVARKLAIAVWYAMKGLLPDLLDTEDVMRGKFKKIAEELTEEVILKIGYKTVKDFVEEYTGLILLRRFTLFKENAQLSRQTT
jgi:transposase